MLADTACDDCGIPFRTPAGGHPDRHRIPVPREPGATGPVETITVVICSSCNEKRWLQLARAKGLI